MKPDGLVAAFGALERQIAERVEKAEAIDLVGAGAIEIDLAAAGVDAGLVNADRRIAVVLVGKKGLVAELLERPRNSRRGRDECAGNGGRSHRRG